MVQLNVSRLHRWIEWASRVGIDISNWADVNTSFERFSWSMSPKRMRRFSAIPSQTGRGRKVGRRGRCWLRPSHPPCFDEADLLLDGLTSSRKLRLHLTHL